MSLNRTSIPPQIIEEASAWFVAMRDVSVSTEQRAQFAIWLRASPAHVAAYLDIARLWGAAARISADIPAEALDDSNIIGLTNSERSEHRLSSPLGQRLGESSARSGYARPWRAIAAGILIICLMIAGLGRWWYQTRPPSYATAIGEQRVITLDDGSTVRLNSRSEFAVRMQPEIRQLELVEGQALFEVAHDAARPFIVRSGDIAIKAIGTQFDVYRKRSGTTVTVIEGRVQVAGEGGSVEVAAGEQVTVPAIATKSTKETDTQIPRPVRVNTAAATSWLQQELIFNGQPLSDVLEEFNRYTRTPIILADATLADYKINAVFHTTNPDSLLLFVSRIEGVQIERTDEEIRITRRR